MTSWSHQRFSHLKVLYKRTFVRKYVYFLYSPIFFCCTFFMFLLMYISTPYAFFINITFTTILFVLIIELPFLRISVFMSKIFIKLLLLLEPSIHASHRMALLLLPFFSSLFFSLCLFSLFSLSFCYVRLRWWTRHVWM